MSMSKTITQKETPMQARHAKSNITKYYAKIGVCLFNVQYLSILYYRLELDFTMGEWLGKGGFGHVYEVTSKTDGGSYALKIVRLPDK